MKGKVNGKWTFFRLKIFQLYGVEKICPYIFFLNKIGKLYTFVWSAVMVKTTLIAFPKSYDNDSLVLIMLKYKLIKYLDLLTYSIDRHRQRKSTSIVWFCLKWSFVVLVCFKNDYIIDYFWILSLLGLALCITLMFIFTYYYVMISVLT